MIGKPGDTLVVINWVANPFRGEKFLDAWLPSAAAVLRYGATEWALLRSSEDPQKFDQFAAFANKTDFDRYWYSDEISDARAQANGLYQVPLLPVWWTVEGSGAIVPEPVDA
ncbi:MAG TPA: hypothetical protein VGF74_02445 [Thermoleophilaceae bacterium]|jgi:hypothetical protein